MNNTQHSLQPMSLLSRESSQPLAEQLAQRFVARMRDQLLVSGARLPSVRQCAHMHGVSASTVVAAYDWLVAQGWVEARPNRGFFVRDRAQRSTAAAGRWAKNNPPRGTGGLGSANTGVRVLSHLRGVHVEPERKRKRCWAGMTSLSWDAQDRRRVAARRVPEGRRVDGHGPRMPPKVPPAGTHWFTRHQRRPHRGLNPA